MKYTAIISTDEPLTEDIIQALKDTMFLGDDPAYAFEIEDIKLEQEPTTKNDKPLIKCNICKYYTKMEGCLNDRCERFNDTTHPYCYCFWGKEKGAD